MSFVVNMRHNICETIYDVTPGNFLRGRRCPQCSESRGEEKTRIYLQNNHPFFVPEYTFDGLTGVGGGLLRFDFSVFDSSEKLICLIEYDGIFHFEKQYDEDGFESIQIHDKRKNQYCKDNNIPLIRIPYWQFDRIEQILDKWLNKYGLIHNEIIKEIA